MCISSFSNRRIGKKDPMSADGDLFRGSLEFHMILDCLEALGADDVLNTARILRRDLG